VYKKLNDIFDNPSNPNESITSFCFLLWIAEFLRKSLKVADYFMIPSIYFMSSSTSKRDYFCEAAEKSAPAYLPTGLSAN
jgi:hypothetical protein